MSLYPLMLDGAAISSLVVGGGAVATRKVASLLAAGAQVRVVAPEVTAEMEELRAGNAALHINREPYSSTHIGDALFVIAATDDHAVNARIAADARSRGRLVNVVDAPAAGNCVTPAVHRAGDVVVAVTAGGVPAAASRIRDAIARVIDSRYADAVGQLSTLRRTLLDGGHRDHWSAASAALVGDDFCDRVESGRFNERAAEWR